ncbi:MAG: nucleotidyltransferase domain-containing protein [Candidatus Methanoplasma sp.]|nr:nucleotidyltransferase domain-containing protein [Candidatus Methanoplasma sp.]
MADHSIDEIIKIISPIAERYGIERVYLFGSRARGDNASDSDYDFSIDPGRMDNILDFFGFIDELEEALGSRVDVVSRRSLKEDRFYRYMVADEVVVYG